MMSLGQRIRQARRAKGLFQREAAEKAGIDERAWQYYETGKHYPGFLALVDIADTLEVSLDWLAERERYCGKTGIPEGGDADEGGERPGPGRRARKQPKDKKLEKPGDPVV